MDSTTQQHNDDDHSVFAISDDQAEPTAKISVRIFGHIYRLLTLASIPVRLPDYFHFLPSDHFLLFAVLTCLLAPVISRFVACNPDPGSDHCVYGWRLLPDLGARKLVQRPRQ